MKPARTPPSLTARKKIAFSLAVVAIVLFGAELICRVLGLGTTLPVADYISDWHDTPDGQTFWVVRGKGYNRDGMRDRDHAGKALPGVHRIVCLGDSVTEGHGLPQTSSYPFIFEAFLQQLGLPVEVFTIAASGWSTTQEAAAYRAIARRYKPEHVFLGFCLNDVAEMNNNLTAPPPALVSFVMRYSVLVRSLVGAERRQVRDVHQLFAQQNAPAVRTGWTRVFDELSDLREQTARDGCDLSVVIFPFRFQLEAGAPAPIAQRTLVRFCRERGIPCLDLLPALREIGTQAFIDDSHLSRIGTRAVAEELIRWGRSGCVMCGHDLESVQAETCPQCDHPRTPPPP